MWDKVKDHISNPQVRTAFIAIVNDMSEKISSIITALSNLTVDLRTITGIQVFIERLQALLAIVNQWQEADGLVYALRTLIRFLQGGGQNLDQEVQKLINILFELIQKIGQLITVIEVKVNPNIKTLIEQFGLLIRAFMQSLHEKRFDNFTVFIQNFTQIINAILEQQPDIIDDGVKDILDAIYDLLTKVKQQIQIILQIPGGSERIGITDITIIVNLITIIDGARKRGGGGNSRRYSCIITYRNEAHEIPNGQTHNGLDDNNRFIRVKNQGSQGTNISFQIRTTKYLKVTWSSGKRPTKNNEDKNYFDIKPGEFFEFRLDPNLDNISHDLRKEQSTQEHLDVRKRLQRQTVLVQWKQGKLSGFTQLNPIQVVKAFKNRHTTLVKFDITPNVQHLLAQ